MSHIQHSALNVLICLIPIMSFQAKLTESLIREMCMDVMRIFVDKDEMWLEFRRQISAS